MEGDRPQFDVVEIAIGSQHPFSLFHHTFRNQVPALEKQLALDNARPRLDVQLVRQPEQRVVFQWIAQVKDILVEETDLADPGACCLQFCK